MATVEGQLTVRVIGGKFDFYHDLYIQVKCDDKAMWKTDEQDTYTPAWDAKMVKHIKGEFEMLNFNLMDEDTFSKDDHIGTASIPIASLLNPAFTKMERVAFDGTLPMMDKDGKQIGTLRVDIEYCPGDVGVFQSLADHFHF